MRGPAPHLCPAFNPEHVQFYNIEMGRLADGMIAVSITATLCPTDGELITQELTADRTQTLEEALAFIKHSLVIQ
jgi:hypothetical protein